VSYGNTLARSSVKSQDVDRPSAAVLSNDDHVPGGRSVKPASHHEPSVHNPR